MKQITAAVLLLIAATLASAQTTYTQSTPFTCQVSSETCQGTENGQQNIQLVGGGWYRFFPGFIEINAQSPVLHAYVVQNNPSDYSHITQMPVHPNAGPFQILFSITDPVNGVQHTGQVNGQAHWVQSGRWSWLVLDSSTITVN